MIVIRKNELKEAIIEEAVGEKENGALLCEYLSEIVDRAFYELFQARADIMIGVEKDD